MERKNTSRRMLQFFSGFVIWAMMTLVWTFVWYRFYATTINLPYFRRGNWAVVALYGIILFLITQFYGGYRVGFYRRGDIIFSGIMSMVVTNGLTFLQSSLINRDWVNPWPILAMSAVDFALFWIWATAAGKVYVRLNPPRHLLVVYGGSSLTQSLVMKMATREDKYVIQEAVNIEEGLRPVLERIDGYEAVLICDVKSGHRNRLLKHCYKRGIRVYMTPKISDILIRGAASIHLFDSPLLLSRNDGLTLEQRLVKRGLDVVLCGLGVVIASPFMLLIVLAIKLYDGGPALYRQVRLTKGGKEFQLLKFRSMIVDAEKKGGVQLSTEGDSRITPVGKVIRKIRFDELPQLFNILRGDMSLVGPRPERPEIAEEYKQSMEEFDFRLKVKAGLTGYAQVLGKYNTTPYDKLKLDLMYITGYSLLLDLKLILQTVKTLFMKESTEGIEEGKKTAGDSNIAG